MRKRRNNPTYKCIRKITDTQGESLAETMVSILIIAIALLMLASSAIASRNLLDHANRVINLYNDANSSMEVSSDPLTDADASGKKLVIKDRTTGNNRSIITTGDAPEIVFYTNQSESGASGAGTHYPELVRFGVA